MISSVIGLLVYWFIGLLVYLFICLLFNYLLFLCINNEKYCSLVLLEYDSKGYS